MSLIVGIDEAGRGPIAGPLAVGIVAVPEKLDLHELFPKLNDSKQLTEKMREHIFNELEEQAKGMNILYHVSLISASVVDAGLTKAVQRGIDECVQRLLPNPSEGKIFLDGSLKASPEYEQETIIKGDSLIPSIMLASVIAKVTRDRYMVQLSRKYPAYGFEVHKGYGTKVHYAALRENGFCAEHRQLFLRTFFAQQPL